MRALGPLFVRTVGDKQTALARMSLARVCLGRMKAYLAGRDGMKRWTLEDGTVIRTRVAGANEIVEIDVRRVGRCEALPPPRLVGFSAGLRPSNGTDPVVLTPTDTAYRLYIHDGSQKRPGTSARTYQYKVVDTCGTVEPWYDTVSFGNIDWRGQKGVVLSWFGPANRYFDAQIETGHPDNGPWTPKNASEIYPGGRVYYRGRTIKKKNGDVMGFSTRVAGAALTTYDGKVYLVVIFGTILDLTSTTEMVSVIPVAQLTEDALLLDEAKRQDLAQIPLDTTVLNSSPWFFNQSGNVAVGRRKLSTSALGLKFFTLSFAGEGDDVVASYVLSDGASDVSTSTSDTVTEDGSTQDVTWQDCDDDDVTTTMQIGNASSTTNESSIQVARYADFNGDVFVMCAVTKTLTVFDETVVSRTYEMKQSACLGGHPDVMVPRQLSSLARQRQVTDRIVVTINGQDIAEGQADLAASGGMSGPGPTFAAEMDERPTGSITSTETWDYIGVIVAMDIRDAFIAYKRVIGKMTTAYEGDHSACGLIPTDGGGMWDVTITTTRQNDVEAVTLDTSMPLTLATEDTEVITSSAFVLGFPAPSGVGTWADSPSFRIFSLAGAFRTWATSRRPNGQPIAMFDFAYEAMGGTVRSAFLSGSSAYLETGFTTSEKMFPIGVL